MLHPPTTTNDPTHSLMDTNGPSQHAASDSAVHHGLCLAAQNMEHKFVELLAAEFRAAPQELVHQMVDYRYKSLQSKLALTQASLADVYAMVRPRPAHCGCRCIAVRHSCHTCSMLVPRAGMCPVLWQARGKEGQNATVAVGA